MTDEQFFTTFPDRRARIRLPGREQHIDKQRAVRYLSECELQFRSLGPHAEQRRRIIVHRLPADHPSHPNHLLKIPFLQFADEKIEDTDQVLMKIVHDLMLKEAAK